jgi:hypothetical protein
MRSEKFSLQDAEKVALLTCPTPAITSPARPESAKTDSSPWNAPFPMHRSRLETFLSVVHSENKLAWQLGVGGWKSYASGAFIGCGLAERPF